MFLYCLLRPLAEAWTKSHLVNGWQGVRFICYHSVTENDSLPASESVFTVTKGQFRQHIEWFKENGLEIVSLKSALRLLETGKARCGQYISITFDDGLMDNWSVAWPILKEFGITAHFFVVSNLIDRPSPKIVSAEKSDKKYMGEEELRGLVEEGASVGSHTDTHPFLTKLDASEIYNELYKSKRRIESVIKRQVSTVAYPKGAYNSMVLNAASKVGYRYGFKIDFGSVQRVSDTNRYVLPRVPIRGGSLDWSNYLNIRGGYDWATHFTLLKKAVKWRVFK